ncbi:MAG TPA: TonB-dependent receptor [Steroidobacteraceae bacterium]|nr:TonB-dependent receptor [Steroidobacteraceae bacterium]
MSDPFESRRPLLAAWRVSIAVAAAIAGSGVALAQQATETELEEVVVTGSRIIREGMTSPTPVTSLSADELLQVNPQSISQALASLPAMTGSTTQKSIGGRTTLGPGSFLNLRNLGNNRNLVLLDGRRLVPANIAGNTDINLLPQGLIQNVSVVTGGASAAYGSDAMAGVTNFTLNTRFEGLKIDVNGGISTRDDGGSHRVALAGGTSFLDGRLHVIGSFDWRRNAQAYKENRDWARQYCATIGIPGVNAGNMSPANPRQTIACNVTQPIASYGGAILSGPLAANGPIQFDDQGNPVPFLYGSLRGGTLMVGGSGNYVGDTANFNTPTDNKVYFGHAMFEVNDNVEAFVQGTYATADSDYTQTPAYFYSTTPLNIQTGNAFLPASIQDRMTTLGVNSFALGIVPKSWGNIDITSGYATWDITGGLKGTLAGNWKWDVYYEQGRSAFRLDYHDQISLSRLYRAVDAVRAPNGSIVCQSALANPALYGDCVPLNPFGAGAPSQAALDYIHGPGQPWNYNIMRQKVAAASISGELFSTWAGPVAVGAGVEYRELNGEILSDSGSNGIPDWSNIRGLPASLTGRVGDWSTSNVQPTAGEYDVKEAFAETLVPLARGMNLLYELDLNAAFRVTDYSQSGTVNTWKVGLSYRPIQELLLRATRSRDIRAPGIGDLYTRDSSGPDIIIDDIINGTGNRPVAVIISGNPDLEPEIGDTWTAGFTYQPTWLSGFAMSADYYDIQIKDMLASVGGQEVVRRCAQGQAEYCANLVGPPNAFTGVRSRTMNLSQARTQGVDLDLNYRTQLLGNNTLFRVVATRLIEQSTTVPNATTSVYTDRVGDMGIGYPKWVANALVNMDIGPLGLNANARYIHKGARNTTWLPGDIAPQFATIGSVTTFDVGARYGLEMSGSPEIYLNVQNVFDRDPALVPSSALVGGQTNVGLYDTMGRYFTMGVRLQF